MRARIIEYVDLNKARNYLLNKTRLRTKIIENADQFEFTHQHRHQLMGKRQHDQNKQGPEGSEPNSVIKLAAFLGIFTLITFELNFLLSYFKVFVSSFIF